uniref:DUF4325 domain-containing protein n=1 Tax=Candidatus Kentrum sp. TUN TaxID=2126343 RepID=A0A451A2E0_9GAMM|nr:MAG: protein of unknown function (DUF4325) [Candidatus Kentron sp. TUN]VFK60162.1 MAG: protein of unknown function (DUF4325) [Candidatus Kentron sp. TUN]
MEEIVIKIPDHFSFNNNGIFDVVPIIGVFDWSVKNKNVLLDLSDCNSANYQALSLITLYVWFLYSRNKCRVEFRFSHDSEGASKMWRKMGAKGWHQVLINQNERFKGNRFKPLIALRKESDFRLALSKVESYTESFDIEYEKTLRYVMSELMYNTLEHGRIYFKHGIKDLILPSIIQFSWYRNSDELRFIVADLGTGIKNHLEQAYEPFEDHASAIIKAIEPRVSGTFGPANPYSAKNNAGFGLYLSSNIIRRLSADMHIISGNGSVHISPTDITTRSLKSHWPGTFYVVDIHLSREMPINLQDMMAEFREQATKEIRNGEQEEKEKKHYLSINNLFGLFAEDKESAIKCRDKYLIPAAERDEDILIDFSGVKSAPHSFLNALLAAVIREIGIKAYKKIKIINAATEIRETIDFILDENT